MKKTGVFATKEEITMLKDMMNTPMIMLQCGPPPNPAKECHKLALDHGLPEISGYYGLDLNEGEFLES